MKDNKLIAEFMGYDISTIASNGIEVVEFENNDVKVENLRYHTSWDWLMPVLSKIADEVEATHYPLYRSIDEAYNEAVTFIKTFNEEKEKSS